jgi:exopolysaccharide production protein ExoQ
MAPIALFICVVFIAYLLMRDFRCRASVSAAIWIPTILLLILGSRSLSEWFGQGVYITRMGNDAARSPIDETFYLSVLVGSLIIVFLRRVKLSKLLAANSTITLLYLFFAVSVVWSGDPLGSSKRLCKDFGQLFVLSVILSEKDPLEAMRAIYFRCACVLFPLSVVFIRYYPRLGRGYSVAGEQMYTGVTTQKNSLGEIVLVFSLFLVWDWLETRPPGMRRLWSRIPWDRLILLIIGAWLLDISQSKTALVCLVIGLVLIGRSGWLASRMISRMVLLGALSVPFLLFFTQEFSWIISPLIEALGRNMTFTGRANIWEHITATTVNPIIGAGYWNFWGGKGGLAIMQAMQTVVPNAHCGYVDMYLDGGCIALILLLVVLFASGKRLIRILPGTRYELLKFSILIVAILYNLSESNFFRLSPLWFTTLLAIIDFPSRQAAVGTRENASIGNARHSPTADLGQKVDRWRGVYQSDAIYKLS